MKKQSLYRELSSYYDLIYSWKDYTKDGDAIYKLINKYKKSDGKDLLEVACGTGNHLHYFKQHYSCVGLDINPGILKIAREKNKDVSFRKGDMIDFSIHKKFDVITCLFSSIGYVKTQKNLKKTIFNFAGHLKVGGVVIIEPWFTKSVYKAGSPHMTTYESENLKIARLTVSKLQGNVSKMDMHYLIAEKNKEVKHFVDIHELGLFETETTLQYMKDAGFKARYLKHGLMKDRGLFIGVKG